MGLQEIQNERFENSEYWPKQDSEVLRCLRFTGLNDGVKELWGQPNTWTDWQCSCGFINFERRLECLQCTKPKLRAEGFAHDNAGATCLIQ